MALARIEPPTEVLVTGAAGFIAFHLIEALLRQGQAVFGIDNFDPFYSGAQKERNVGDLRAISKETRTPFHFQPLDLNRLSASDLENHPISVVIHLAGKAGVRPSIQDPEGYLKVNVNGTLRLLEICRQKKIQEMVFGSSSSVYGDDTAVPFSEESTAAKPISPYAATKRAAELLCHSYAHLHGMRIAMLRFFTVYGPRQRPDLAIHKFARLIQEGKPIPLFGNGKSSRDYTFCTDIVQGILCALRWVEKATQGACEIFNLGGSSPTSLADLVHLIERAMDKRAEIQWLAKQAGDVERTFADLTKSKRTLGYEPQTPMEEGMKAFVDWFNTSHTLR
jgi:UDP-glucuronate 4-epimerase